MPDSNELYVTTPDGRRITYTRWRYEETIKQERVLAQVNDLVTSQASAAVAPGQMLAQQQYGQLLRVVVPNLLDQYGKVNATAAVKFYDQLELEWLKANGEAARQRAGRGNVRLQARRYAVARTAAAVQVGQMDVAEFQAKYAADYELAAKSERVIGQAMKIRARDGHEASVQAMNNAMTREVASYHRDTILFNSALDPNVSRVQRVAQASACEFCRLMALGSTNGSVRVSSYAVKFHDHCHCTIQPLFDGEAPVRPDYYDEFEKDYDQARKEAGSGNSRDILAQMRRQSKQPSTAPVTYEALKPNDYSGIAERVAFQRRLGFSEETFRPEVSKAVENYTNGTGEYQNMNGLLRDPLGYAKYLSANEALDTKANIENLTNIIDKAPALDKPIVTYRGIDADGDIAKRILALKPGESFQDLGFASSSLNRLIGAGRGQAGVVLEIQNPVGTRGLMTEGFYVERTAAQIEDFAKRGVILESEWLLQRGSRFEIISRNGNTVTVKVAQE